MNPLERKLDARNGHVQFDEREVETECRAGYSGTGNRKGWFNSYGLAYTLLRHFSTLHGSSRREEALTISARLSSPGQRYEKTGEKTDEMARPIVHYPGITEPSRQ